jgi:hypothetical protein
MGASGVIFIPSVVEMSYVSKVEMAVQTDECG